MHTSINSVVHITRDFKKCLFRINFTRIVYSVPTELAMNTFYIGFFSMQASNITSIL